MRPPLPESLPLLWAQAEQSLPPRPKLHLYRGRTLSLLRRYYRLSFDIGRMPSLLGREVFRSKVTRYRTTSLEEMVIFVHDVERCLQRLDSVSQLLIARVVLQEYTHDEAATLLDCTRRTVLNQFPLAVDRLTEVFLEVGMLQPISCQDPQTEENSPTDCEQRE